MYGTSPFFMPIKSNRISQVITADRGNYLRHSADRLTLLLGFYTLITQPYRLDLPNYSNPRLGHRQGQLSGELSVEQYSMIIVSNLLTGGRFYLFQI